MQKTGTACDAFMRITVSLCCCLLVKSHIEGNSDGSEAHSLSWGRHAITHHRALLVQPPLLPDEKLSLSLRTTLPAAFVIVLVGAVATAAGAGGGALFVPLFSSFLHFSVKDATALSQAVITGGAVAGTLFALFQKHPKAPELPLIQFDLALVLIPSLLLGTSIGVLLNKVFPVWLITLCLIAILTYLTYKTFTKGFRLYRQEQQVLIGQTASPVQLLNVQTEHECEAHSDAVHNLLRSISDRPASPRSSLFDIPEHPVHAKQMLPSQRDKARPSGSAYKHARKAQLFPTDSNSSAYSVTIPATTEEQHVELTALESTPSCNENDFKAQLSQDSDSADDDRPLLQEDERGGSCQTSTAAQAHDQQRMLVAELHGIWVKSNNASAQLPWRKITAASTLWVVFASLQLLKGLSNRCSTAYWSLYLSQAMLSTLASAYFVRAACQGPSVATFLSSTPAVIADSIPLAWSAHVLTMASVIAVGGGAMAGTVGMGGGVVMGPLLLYLDVPPAASAATSTLMILFSSSAATLSFAVDGHINAQYACIYGILNFVSSFLGVFLLGRAVRRSGKSSIIVLLLAVMMATGAFISAVFGGIESVNDIRTGRDLAFSNVCS